MMSKRAREELAVAMATRRRVLCDDDGSFKFLMPYMDREGLEYVRVGRVPGLRKEIVGARMTVGDQVIYRIEHIPVPTTTV